MPDKSAKEPVSPFKLYLSESVALRLRLAAINSGTTMSVVASEILDRSLPNLSIVESAKE